MIFARISPANRRFGLQQILHTFSYIVFALGPLLLVSGWQSGRGGLRVQVRRRSLESRAYRLNHGHIKVVAETTGVLRHRIDMMAQV